MQPIEAGRRAGDEDYRLWQAKQHRLPKPRKPSNRHERRKAAKLARQRKVA